MSQVYVAFNPTWSQVRIWPLSQANGGPMTVQPAPPGDQNNQGGHSTESIIYGYSTITTEMVNTVGARTWTGTETRTTWVPISTTMVPIGAAPTSAPPAEASAATELHWVPSAVVQTLIQSKATATWTETATQTTWVQVPITQTSGPDSVAETASVLGGSGVTQTPSPDAQQQPETASTTSTTDSTVQSGVIQSAVSDGQPEQQTGTATESTGQPPIDGSLVPTAATQAPRGSTQSASETGTGTSTPEVSASGTGTPAPAAQTSGSPVAR